MKSKKATEAEKFKEQFDELVSLFVKGKITEDELSIKTDPLFESLDWNFNVFDPWTKNMLYVLSDEIISIPYLIQKNDQKTLDDYKKEIESYYYAEVLKTVPKKHPERTKFFKQMNEIAKKKSEK